MLSHRLRIDCTRLNKCIQFNAHYSVFVYYLYTTAPLLLKRHYTRALRLFKRFFTAVVPTYYYVDGIIS